MSLIYLASPYSAYKGGREAAFKEVCAKAAELMQQGYNVFCPIAHSHSIEVESGMKVKDGDWWLKQDFAVLERCSQLFVYCMEGWEESYGVKAEIAFAKKHGIPITYHEDALAL